MVAAGVVGIVAGAECWRYSRRQRLAPQLLSRLRPQLVRVHTGVSVRVTRRSGGPASDHYRPYPAGRPSLGITDLSKVPLRLVTFTGLAGVSSRATGAIHTPLHFGLRPRRHASDHRYRMERRREHFATATTPASEWVFPIPASQQRSAWHSESQQQRSNARFA